MAATAADGPSEASTRPEPKPDAKDAKDAKDSKAEKVDPKGGGKPGTYQMPRPAGACAVSGRAIGAGEKFMAAVRETATGLERLDVAPEHWEGFVAGHRDDLLGYWQTVMPAPEQKKKVFVDDEVLCTLFERLAEAAEPAKVAFRFVLGLILMRKRLVIYDGTRHEPAPAGSPAGTPGRDVWVVRMKGREDRLDLVDPKLDEKQVVEVSQQLGEILNEEM